MVDQGTLVSRSRKRTTPVSSIASHAPPGTSGSEGDVPAPRLQSASRRTTGGARRAQSVAPAGTASRRPRDPYTILTCRTSRAIRGTATLRCPPEVGYETAVTVLKVNEAIEAKQRLSFRPDEFRI